MQGDSSNGNDKRSERRDRKEDWVGKDLVLGTTIRKALPVQGRVPAKIKIAKQEWYLVLLPKESVISP